MSGFFYFIPITYVRFLLRYLPTYPKFGRLLGMLCSSTASFYSILYACLVVCFFKTLPSFFHCCRTDKRNGGGGVLAAAVGKRVLV